MPEQYKADLINYLEGSSPRKTLSVGRNQIYTPPSSITLQKDYLIAQKIIRKIEKDLGRPLTGNEKEALFKGASFGITDLFGSFFS